jgi:hypothetical protein
MQATMQGMELLSWHQYEGLVRTEHAATPQLQ